MPFALRENPEALRAEDVDDYWSRGWFRMRQALFTTHFLEFEGQFFSAVWLRVNLPQWSGDREFQALRRRNSAFRVEFRPCGAVPENDLEELFTRYRDSLPFDVAPSLTDLLVGHEESTVFDSHQIRLYDGERLVAAGVFDLGREAAGGITSFYDPDYRRYSLGKYLIYLKMEHCRQRGLQWFYPGYFVPGRPRFDYKLDLATPHIEYLDLASGGWLPFRPELPRPDPLAQMKAKLAAVDSRLIFNGHLSIHLSPQVQGVELFDFPVFLNILPHTAPAYLLVVFDPRDSLYHLLHARSVYRVPVAHPQPQLLESDLLQVQRLLFSTQSAEEMTAAVGFVTA